MLVNLLKYFLLLFVCLILYYIFPKKTRWIVLLICSLLYYYLLSGNLMLPIIFSAFSIYLGGIGINAVNNRKLNIDDKNLKRKFKNKNKRLKKIILLIVLSINIGILIYLKYYNFILFSIKNVFDIGKISPKEIVLPLGISYYTLMAISYITDVYRSKYKAINNPFKVLLYLIFFPSVQEGPINRFDDVSSKLYEGNKFNYNNICIGVLLILWGLLKKMVIADRIGIYVSNTFGVSNGIVSLLSVIFYTIQLYAEFSGFIDMAMGGAKLFGIDLSANFKRPFFSRNVEEFWRRWHITLGTFLKDYVFYPISLSRVSMKLSKFNNKHFSKHLSKFFTSAFPLFFVWFLNGLWHGASSKYIIYGLYYYVIMMIGLLIEPLFNKININKKWLNTVKIMRTWIFVMIGMTIFRATSIHEAFNVVKSIFYVSSDNILNFGLTSIDFIIILIFVIVLFFIGFIEEKGENVSSIVINGSSSKKYFVYYILIMIIIIFGIYGPGYNASDFIYGQF